MVLINVPPVHWSDLLGIFFILCILNQENIMNFFCKGFLDRIYCFSAAPCIPNIGLKVTVYFTSNIDDRVSVSSTLTT